MVTSGHTLKVDQAVNTLSDLLSKPSRNDYVLMNFTSSWQNSKILHSLLSA